jgi:hypothetical protein
VALGDAAPRSLLIFRARRSRWFAEREASGLSRQPPSGEPHPRPSAARPVCVRPSARPLGTFFGEPQPTGLFLSEGPDRR